MAVMQVRRLREYRPADLSTSYHTSRLTKLIYDIWIVIDRPSFIGVGVWALLF
jgi:hypothetical protein